MEARLRTGRLQPLESLLVETGRAVMIKSFLRCSTLPRLALT
ncbi:MAG: hypothetical protein ACLTOV_09875 [Phocaeicola sp.]